MSTDQICEAPTILKLLMETFHYKEFVTKLTKLKHLPILLLEAVSKNSA